MKAIEISQPGGPEVLVPVDRPMPTIGAGDVLVKVAAAGVNRPDLLQRQGRYPPPPGVTDIPGLEIAGTIDSVGANVTAWRPGDRVCALVSGGGYAEFCAVPAPQCLPAPRGMTVTQAAALPETTFTVWTNVFERGRLTSGESILIHGGSGGIGTTAIQLAHAAGARVFATAGSADKCSACESLGAEKAINYRATDFVAAIKEATNGRGVDVVLDMVAGDYVQRNIEALAMDGRLVMIGRQGGVKSEIDVMPILRKRLVLTGSTLRTRSVDEKGALARAVHQHVWPWFESGQVRVIVHQTFPLHDAAAAHRLMESSAHVGKIVLQVQS
jgi:NADPH2:quinone reductase